MTYIELARAVRARMGLQGSGPSSIETTSPIEQQIVQAVSDAWGDIQRLRDDWRWMRGTHSFYTAVGTTAYTLGTIFPPGYRFRKFRKGSFYIEVNSQKTPLYFLDYDNFQYRYNNQTTNSRFNEFTIRPSDSAIIVPRPDELYRIYFDYQKSNQTLSSNTSVPEMPAMHHQCIVYGALEKMGVSVLSLEQYDHYAQQYILALGQLMRDQLPKKQVRPVFFA